MLCQKMLKIWTKQLIDAFAAQIRGKIVLPGDDQIMTKHEKCIMA